MGSGTRQNTSSYIVLTPARKSLKSFKSLKGLGPAGILGVGLSHGTWLTVI